MVDKFLMCHAWIPALFWAILYIGDCYLTLYGARLLHKQSIIEIEGSYELTPDYQDDVDKARKFSPRSLAWLLFGAFVLLVPSFAGTANDLTMFYGFCVGMLIIPELVIHMRHFTNIMYYRRLASSDPGLSGHLRTSKQYSYALSSAQLGSWAVFLLIISALTLSPILLGGAVAVARYSYRDHKLGKAFKSTTDLVKQYDTNNN